MTLTPHVVRRTEHRRGGPALVPGRRRELAVPVRGAAVSTRRAAARRAPAEPPRIEPIRPPSATPTPPPARAEPGSGARARFGRRRQLLDLDLADAVALDVDHGEALARRPSTTSPPLGTDAEPLEHEAGHRLELAPTPAAGSRSVSRSSAAETVPSTTSEPSRSRSTGRSSQSYSSWISPTISSMQVLEGDEPGHRAVLVDHERHVAAPLLQLLQQLARPSSSRARSATGCRILRITTGWRFSSRRSASLT